MAKNVKNNGFSVIEIVMAVAIVGLVVAVGWLYFGNVVNKNSRGDEMNSSKNAEQKSATLKSHVSSGLGVEFDYPSTWSVTQNTDTKLAKGDFNSAQNGSENLLVKSPSGYTLLFNTVATEGLGGTGPCDNVNDQSIVYEGDSKVGKSYVINFVDNGAFVLRLSSSKSGIVSPISCPSLDYASLIDVKEPVRTANNLCCATPHQFEFGSLVWNEDPISKTKPSDKEYKEAVEILKSVRKI